MPRFMTFPTVVEFEIILGLRRVFPLNPRTIGALDISVPTDQKPYLRMGFWVDHSDLSRLIGDATRNSERASPDR